MRLLTARGYRQYEISNFAKPGFRSLHNLKYWDCEEYLGLGPSAHSFLGGRRVHEEPSLRAFLTGNPPVQDGTGGDFDEFAMLRLRLAAGLTDAGCRARFGRPIPKPVSRAAKQYEPAGLVRCFPGGFRFTPRGFLVSNPLTASVLFSAS